MLKIGQEIEVRPGIVARDANGTLTCRPLRSKIVSLFAEHNDLQYAVPGGLIGKHTHSLPNLSVIFSVFLHCIIITNI